MTQTSIFSHKVARSGSFRKQTLLECCNLFKKLIFKLEIIRNIYRTNPSAEIAIVAEVSKWVNDSTIKRRCQSVNLLLEEISEKDLK